MAFFKFRKGGDESTAPTAQADSVEVLRRRAKNRLIGAAILVLIGVVGFPLLVDKQPRSVAVDLPIDIPDRNKVLPLAVPPAAESAAPAAEPARGSAPSRAAASAPTQSVEPVQVQTGPVVEAAKVQEGRKLATEAKPAAAADARYVVQVGSFAEEQRVRDVRLKLERAGIKTYVQTVETKDGKRVRVRVGPFASRAEAERAAQKIKKLDLPAAIMGL